MNRFKYLGLPVGEEGWPLSASTVTHRSVQQCVLLHTATVGLEPSPASDELAPPKARTMEMQRHDSMSLTCTAPGSHTCLLSNRIALNLPSI